MKRWKSFFARTLPEPNENPISGLACIYGFAEDGEKLLVTQAYRDREGEVKCYAGYEFNAPAFLGYIEDFAKHHRTETLDQFASGLVQVFVGATVPPRPETPFTDMEYRILLAAVGREEKICQRIDQEQGHNVLTSVIRSIYRKLRVMQNP